MDKLTENILLNIFQYFNLNEQSQIKLVNQKFRNLINFESKKITELIIFDKRAPVNGKLKFDSEREWSSNNIVYVTDLNKFLQLNSEKIKNLKVLIIFGFKNCIIDFNYYMADCYHLELYDCTFTNREILVSPKLLNLYNFNTEFKITNTQFKTTKLKNLSISSDLFINIYRQFEEFNYLEIQDQIDCSFINKLLYFKVYNLKINSTIKIAIELCKKIEYLEKINLITIESTNIYSFMRLKKFIKEDKRDNLNFCLLGVKLTRRNFERFENIFLEHKLDLSLINNKLHLLIDNQQKLDDLENNDDLLFSLYSLIDSLQFNEIFISNMIFNKFTNVRSIILNLKEHDTYDLDYFFNYFIELNNLEIYLESKVKLSNQFFITLSTSCNKLEYFKMQIFNEISFGFLNRLISLKYLIITSYYAIKNRQFFRLFKQLKHLCYFNFRFYRQPNGTESEQLSLLKRNVLSILEEELGYKKVKFNIILYHKPIKFTSRKSTIIKYYFERTDYLNREFSKEEEVKDHNKLVDIIELKDSINHSSNKYF